MFIDCHSHLDGFPDPEVAGILDRAVETGVGAVITTGTTLESSLRAVHLASVFPRIFAGVGIHPQDVTGPIDESLYGRLRDLACSSDRVIVMSEIGLDFQEKSPDRAVQYQAFREQVRLARELSFPVVFHSREAHEETLRVL
ncbi:MAG: hypothetical protein FJ317_03380, partial [SAR202 cluster bacterium]|nr:hypothetical protein [SAR202 cluster bacterium]